MEPGEISVDIDEVKLEETRELVEKEIDHNLQESKKSEGYNPFHIPDEEYEMQVRIGDIYTGLKKYLPGNPNRKIFVDSGIQFGTFDISQKENNKELVEISGVDEQWSRHSDLYLNQSLSQFLETVDKAIIAEGFSENEFEELTEKYIQQKIPHEEFYNRLLPVYVRLRAMGYTRRDFGT